MKQLLYLTFLLASVAYSQDVTSFVGLNANAKIGYARWSSFDDFRKEYNSVNDTSLTRNLGSLSDQYGFSLGIDCFVENHLYAAVSLTKSYSRTSAKFTNDAKRVMESNFSEIGVFIGWLQPAKKGYWTLTTGFDFAFGVVRSYPVFADGTRYHHTGGLSGEFHGIAIGLPLRFEVSRSLTPWLDLRISAQANYFFNVSDLGLQSAFVSSSEGNIASNGKAILPDISNISLTAGLSCKIFK
jgi:hypothetical protein